MRFRDKVANGIGLACAERLAREQAAVAIVDVDEAAGQAAAVRLSGEGGNALFVRCDVGESAEVAAALEAVKARLGEPDILVNNAGLNRPGDFLDMAEEDFDLVLRTNLKSVFLFGQAVARAMVASGRAGAIVNMSSGNAVITGPRVSAYAASKGGIASLTKAMALALAPHRIRVNAVGPGTILTEMVATAIFSSEDARRSVLSRTPAGRCGEPSEVAAVVAFLASSDASYITGQTIYPDGGRLILNYTVPVSGK
jgi:NAD(P)-dependent dehydrogenase (short-subunit alcohol dehydrogenase family)